MTAEIVPFTKPDFRRPPGLPTSTSDLAILDAVKATLMGAGDKKVADILGVHPDTLPFHKISREWQAIKAKIWPELRTSVHTDFLAARNLAIAQLTDRLQNGDDAYNMMGEYVGKRPLRAKDLTVVLDKVTAGVRDLEKELGITSDDESKIGLVELADGLRRYAQAKDITPQP